MQTFETGMLFTSVNAVGASPASEPMPQPMLLFEPPLRSSPTFEPMLPGDEPLCSSPASEPLPVLSTGISASTSVHASVRNRVLQRAQG